MAVFTKVTKLDILNIENQFNLGKIKKFKGIKKGIENTNYLITIKNKKYIGDIAISFEIVNKRSKLSNFFVEFDKLWIHGYFHLIGYDHKKLKDFKKMAKKENLILNHFHNIN